MIFQPFSFEVTFDERMDLAVRAGEDHGRINLDLERSREVRLLIRVDLERDEVVDKLGDDRGLAKWAGFELAAIETVVGSDDQEDR